MSEGTSNTSSGGIGFTGLLTIVFIVMKLMNYGPVGNWSWWMVFCPIWGSILLILAILATVGIVWFVVWAILSFFK